MCNIISFPDHKYISRGKVIFFYSEKNNPMIV